MCKKFRKDMFMDNYQMNRSGRRPYGGCGMTRMPSQMPCQNTAANASRSSCECPKDDCACHMPGCPSPHEEMFSHLSHLPDAMAYVPCQKFDEMFDLDYALQVGTLFPQLCKPFCGKRGGCR